MALSVLRSSSRLNRGTGRLPGSKKWRKAPPGQSLKVIPPQHKDSLPRYNHGGHPGPRRKGVVPQVEGIFGPAAATAVVLGASVVPGPGHATVSSTDTTDVPVDPVGFCDPAFGPNNAEVDIDALPEDVRPTAEWVDEEVGNANTNLSANELIGYANGPSQPQGPVARLLQAFANLVGLSGSSSVTTASTEALAQEMTRSGGSGTASDVALLINEVERIPAPILDRAKAAGITFVAGRDSVLDYLPDLGSSPPRGWPSSTNWSSVPGVYNPGGREVVISTRVDAEGVRCIPPMLTGHGSDNLVLHEFGHALDYRKAFSGIHSSARSFKIAYSADLHRLSASGETYLLQRGGAGREEAFAESFSRYFSRDTEMATKMPSLFAYWQNFEASLSS